MRRIRHLAVGLVASGLLVTGVGWYLSANDGADQRFESCHFEDGTLVLRFTYGANQAVEPSMDNRDGDLVVSLRAESGSGDTPDIGLVGEARFTVFGGAAPVHYADGESLPCPER